MPFLIPTVVPVVPASQAKVFGGYGFMEEYPVARFYRDAKVLEIGADLAV